ncbi:MAG: translation initiation factor IF-6, partial [Thermoplasmata archaeon]|nr:translation initiation factor IF-6 [Thermoplasmata archaeon]
MLRLGDLNGNPYIGVYCAASERFAVLSDTVEPKAAKGVAQTLGVDIISTKISGCTIVGSLVAMNSNGVIVTNFAEKNEISKFPKELRVAKMEEKLNAAGNNILANDHAAIIHPAASNYTARLIQDVLGVEVQRRRIAGIETVGSACVATNRGLVCHPRTTEEELRELSYLFKVPASAATL